MNIPFDPRYILGGFASPGWLKTTDDIRNKPIPRWPDRQSYRAATRAASKRRNVAKGGNR